MTGWIIVGIIALIFFLIGQIRVGADFSYIGGKIRLSATLCGLRRQLIPRTPHKQRKKKTEAPDGSGEEKKEKKEPETGKKKKKRKLRKKHKKFLKLDLYDIRKLASVARKGEKKFVGGYSCSKLLIHFTAASPDPYITARMSAIAGAVLPALCALVEKDKTRGCCDIRSEIDFERNWPALDFEICVRYRLGAAFGCIFTVLFGTLAVLIRAFFRFLWMRITDPEEYDFRMNRQETPRQFFRRIIREYRKECGKEEKRQDPSDSGNNEEILRSAAEQYAAEHGYTVKESEKETKTENKEEAENKKESYTETTSQEKGTDTMENENVRNENVRSNPISELMGATMENVKSMLHTDTVVGEPITTPDGITLVPVSKVSVGFGGGGVEFGSARKDGNQPYGGGNATGVKVDPIGFLVVKDGTVRMMNITPPACTTVDRILELFPQVMDRVEALINKKSEDI